MNQVHTPGPWTIIGERSFQNPDEDKIWVDASPEFNHTADDEGRWSVAEMRGPDAKANARLIAAAPELLEALIGMLAVHDSVTAGEERELKEKWLPATRAAIAKATGGAQ